MPPWPTSGTRSRDTTLRSTPMSRRRVEIDPRLPSGGARRTCSRTRRSTRRRIARSSLRARRRPTGFHVSVTDHGPGLDPGRARSSVRAVLSRPHRPADRHRHRDGTRDHPRTAGGRGRPRVGREHARRWREVLDGDTRPRPRRDRQRGGVAVADRILIVDDEPNILATMAPLLAARGYDVLDCHDRARRARSRRAGRIPI